MSSFNYAEFFRVWHRTDEQYAAQDLIAIECRVQRELAPLDAWRDDATYTPLDSSEVELAHTETNPFCDDPECPCHHDIELSRQYFWQPFWDGLFTDAEAVRFFYGEQV